MSMEKDPGGRFKKTYELLNLRALKISSVNKIHFQISLKDTIFIQHWNFKSS